MNIMAEEEHIDLKHIFVVGTTDSKTELWRRKLIDSVRLHVELDPVNRAHVLFNTTSSSLEMTMVYSGEPMFFQHLTNAVSNARERTKDVTLEIRNVIGGVWRLEKKYTCKDSEFSQVAAQSDYDTEDAQVQWGSQVPLGTQSVRQLASPELLKKEDIIQTCKDVFLSIDATFQIFENIGGDGIICFAVWKTGEVVLSWDGRIQVDLNVFSVNDMIEIEAFEKATLAKLPNLNGWLRDIQPRGYNRVINFKDDLKEDS